MQAAIENWKKIFDFAMETSRIKHQKVWIPPLETYVLRMVRIAELSDDPKVNETNVRQKLDDIDKVLNIVDAYTAEKTKQMYGDAAPNKGMETTAK